MLCHSMIQIEELSIAKNEAFYSSTQRDTRTKREYKEPTRKTVEVRRVEWFDNLLTISRLMHTVLA